MRRRLAGSGWQLWAVWPCCCCFWRVPGADGLRRLLNKNNLAAARLELERHWTEIGQATADFFVAFRRRVEQEKTATASAEQFSANRAKLSCAVVPTINGAIGNTARKCAFEHPAHVQ